MTTLLYTVFKGKPNTFIISNSQLRVVEWRQNDDGSCVKLFQLVEVASAVIALVSRVESRGTGRQNAVNSWER